MRAAAEARGGFLQRGTFSFFISFWFVCGLGACGNASTIDVSQPLDASADDAAMTDASLSKPVDAGDAGDVGAASDGGGADGGDPDGDEGGALDGGVTFVCTSGDYWTDGDMGDPEMNPGGDCLGCHRNNADAPVFTLAGTVYPTLHELTTCDGTSRARVVVLDRNARSFTLETNDAGNFACGEKAVDGFPVCAGLVFPVSVRLEIGDASGPTVGGQTAGNCNACHSPRGANGAPGRITTSGT